MDFSTAQSLVAVAKSEADKMGVSVSIAVLDAAAHLLAFARSEAAALGTIDVSQRKARTAALFQTDSSELGAGVGPGGPAYTFENTNGGLIVFGGGVVLRNKDGAFIGAIGIAGATIEQDQAIAKAAASSILA
jgi:uncharacterized protein GlcG (DUF336 family)